MEPGRSMCYLVIHNLTPTVRSLHQHLMQLFRAISQSSHLRSHYLANTHFTLYRLDSDQKPSFTVATL